VISPEREAQLAGQFPEAWADLMEAMARLAMGSECKEKPDESADAGLVLAEGARSDHDQS